MEPESKGVMTSMSRPDKSEVQNAKPGIFVSGASEKLSGDFFSATCVFCCHRSRGHLILVVHLARPEKVFCSIDDLLPRNSIRRRLGVLFRLANKRRGGSG